MLASEFLALPEAFGVNELIGGVLRSHQLLDIHQATAGNLLMTLHPITACGTLRPIRTSVEFDQRNVMQPDIFWVAGSESRCTLGIDGYWHGAPDLIIEILSPGTTRQDRDTKYRLYETSGVREYWIVDAEELYIEVYSLRDEEFKRQGIFGLGETFESAVLNGLTLSVDALLKG